MNRSAHLRADHGDSATSAASCALHAVVEPSLLGCHRASNWKRSKLRSTRTAEVRGLGRAELARLGLRCCIEHSKLRSTRDGQRQTDRCSRIPPRQSRACSAAIVRQIGSGASCALQEPRRFEALGRAELARLGLRCCVERSKLRSTRTAEVRSLGRAELARLGLRCCIERSKLRSTRTAEVRSLGRAELARLPSCVKLEAEQAPLYKNRGGSRPGQSRACSAWSAMCVERSELRSTRTAEVRSLGRAELARLGLRCALSAASCALQGTANGGLIGVPASHHGRAELARLGLRCCVERSKLRSTRDGQRRADRCSPIPPR